MGFEEVMAAIKVATVATQAAGALYQTVKAGLSSHEQSQVDANLAELQKYNDEAFPRLDAKLAAAAQQS